MKATWSALLLGALLPFTAAAQQNVLIVIADDLGVDQLRIYDAGDDAPATPTINALAGQGVVFRNAWANPICSPSRAALQTGRHGFRTGVGWLIDSDLPALPLVEVTLPEMLDRGTDGGWEHALIGKWHLGNGSVGGNLNPNLQGYDHFSGTLGNFTSNGASWSYTNWLKVVNGAESVSNVYATTDQVDDALDWIATAQEPWLCVLSFNAPHTPLHKPPDGLYSVNLEGLTPDPAPPATGSKSYKFYQAAVEALDTELGRLFATADAAVLSRTNVFFLGDNGTPPVAVLPPLDYKKAKGTLYQGGVNVPLIVSGPVVANPGRDAFDLVHLVDLFSTVADIAGFSAQSVLPPGAVLDSTSLMPILSSEGGPGLTAPLPGTSAFSLLVYPEEGTGKPYEAYAIRDNRYKLIHVVDSGLGPIDKVLYGPTELRPGVLLGAPYKITTLLDPVLDEFYDLKKDPYEVRDYLEIGFPSSEVKAAHDALLKQLNALLATQ